MRIAIDIRRLADFGVGTYIRNLVQTLARLDSEDQYVLIAREDDGHELGRLPARFETVTSPFVDGSRRNHLQLHFLLRDRDIDLFHVPHMNVPFIVPCPYVITVHDLAEFLFPSRKESGFHSGFHRYLAQRSLNNASRIIAVSRTTRLDLAEFFHIPPQHIEVVHNAIDPRFSVPCKYEEKKRVLERYGVNYPFALYTGNVKRQKNLSRMIEAFAVLKGELRDHPVYGNLKLIVIGDEMSKHPDLRRTVIKTRIQQDVRFLGFVPIDVLRVFYSSAEVFVFPSLYEGFGLPPLEAMAQGTPVVVSNVSSLPEVVGNAAVMVNPENIFDIARGIRRVLLDADARELLRARSK
jgi:glycosyltransferase involved in cell wall biosynthesis